MKQDVVAVFESPTALVPSEIVADILNASTFKLGTYQCDRLYQQDDYSMCDHVVTLHQSLKTVNDALLQLLQLVNLTEVVIIYDGKCVFF